MFFILGLVVVTILTLIFSMIQAALDLAPLTSLAAYIAIGWGTGQMISWLRERHEAAKTAELTQGLTEDEYLQMRNSHAERLREILNAVTVEDLNVDR